MVDLGDIDRVAAPRAGSEIKFTNHEVMHMAKFLYRFLTAGLVVLFASACTAVSYNPPGKPSTLSPAGPAAAYLASLWWVMFALGAAIFVLVIGLLAASYLRGRRATSTTQPDSENGDTGKAWLIRGGFILPLVVLAIVFGYTIYVLAAVENPQNQASLHVNVVGKRWWWQVEYPEQKVTTANEIHIPVGVPVQIKLDSTDVIHSFWVPELHGKMDVIPGHTNTITLQADHVGVYRGECAEFCGLNHALMGLIVVAQNKADFDNWLVQQEQPAAVPSDPLAKQGQQVFISAGCVYCHTVQGVDGKRIVGGSTNLGPDLTHIGSRPMIAGATLTNNANNMAGWVIDAQHIKQGSDMPKMTINPADLQALLAYLASLR